MDAATKERMRDLEDILELYNRLFDKEGSIFYKDKIIQKMIFKTEEELMEIKKNDRIEEIYERNVKKYRK